jgi:hypothetical protein
VHVAYYFPRDLSSHQPTGDRTIARDLIAGLTLAGHTVTVASEFEAQFFWQNPRRLATLPGALLSAFRVVRTTRPDVWLTQGPDRKVPDVIGPLVCLATRTPYVVYDTPGTKAYAELQLAEGRGRHLWTVLPGFLAQKLAFVTADRVITAKGRDHRYHQASRLTGRKLAHRLPGVPTDLFRPSPRKAVASGLAGSFRPTVWWCWRCPGSPLRPRTGRLAALFCWQRRSPRSATKDWTRASWWSATGRDAPTSRPRWSRYVIGS